MLQRRFLLLFVYSILKKEFLKFIGIDITAYVRSPTAPLNFWLPDIVFYSLTSSTLIAELIKILPNNTL